MPYEPLLVDLDHLEGRIPDEDLAQLRAIVPQVDQFVRDTQIFDRIDQRFFADGLIDKVMVFKYIGPAHGEENSEWWVVAGDIPPFIDAAFPKDTAIDALRSYVRLIRLSLDPSKDTEGVLEGFPPLSYQYSTKTVPMTPELEEMITSRLNYIETELIPWMLSGGRS